MPKLSPIKSSQLVRVLERLGFILVRKKGSHTFFKHPNGRVTTVPIHSNEEIGCGLLRKILHDINVSVEEFNQIKKDKL